MAEFVPGFNQLSFDPNSFAGSSQIAGLEHEFNRLNFNILYGGETKALIMKNYYDIDTRLSYVILSTDDSLDPDQATELTNILKYELQENEFLVSVELFGRDPTLQVGNMHQIFTKNLRSWDLYTRDNDPREVRVCFNAAKEPVVQSFTFNTYGTSSGLSSFVWNDTEYQCNYIELGTTPFVLSKPSLALRYKHDGTVYELDTNKLVKTYGNQSIYGKKVFSGSVQSSLDPKDDADLVNLSYANKNFARVSSNGDVTIQLECDMQDVWLAISELKVLLQNGKRLEPKFLEKVTVHGHTDPVLVVFGINDNPDAAVVRPADKTRQEIEEYVLGENEFLAELTYAEGIGPCQSHTSNQQSCLWDAYLANGINSREEAPLFKLVIKALTYELKGIKFKPGDKYNTFYYKSSFYRAFFGINNGPSETVETKDIQSEITLEVPSGTLVVEQNNSGFVDLTSAQEITGVKTFNAAPKSLAEAVDGNDLITKDFATKNFFARENRARNYDILVKMKNDGTWVGFTQFKVLLSNGTRLDIKHLENVSSTTATQPLVAVFKTVTDSAAAIEAPQRQAKTFFDSYQLEEGEYKGTVSFYKVVGKFNPASSDINPWNVYVGNQNANTYDGIYGLHIEQLDKGLRGVNFKFGDAVTSYSYTCQQCGIVFTTDLGSLEVEYKGDMSDGTEATIELPSDSDILGGFVRLAGDQSINGVKTFKKAPKCLASAVEDNDLVTKAYVDSKSSSPDKLPVQEVTVFTKAASNNTILMNFLLLDTVDGTHVDPIYYEEKTAYYYLQEPLRVIFSVNATRYVNSSYTNVNPTAMESRDMDSYVLKDGEFMGSISLPNLVSGDKVNFADTSNNLPWGYFKVTTNGATEDTPVLKIKIEGKLPAVAKASFQADTTYPGEDFKLAVTAGGITKESEVKRAVAGEVLNLTCTEIPIYEGYYVNTLSNQSIMGTKVFKNAPQYLNLAPVARNNGDNLVNFANLASSIGIAVPEKQTLGFGVEGIQSKIHVGGARWNYSWSMNVKFENLVPAFIDPLTGKITPLYIKHYCSDGRAILTTTKPSVEFDRGSVTSKSSDEMDSYTLAQGEYLCKAYWYFLAQYQNTNITGTYIKNNNICGSKVLDLFTTSSSYWKEYQSEQFNDASSYVSPVSSLHVEFYNTPEIRYVRAYGVSCNSVAHSPFGLEDEVTQTEQVSASLDSSTFQELGEYQRANFALNAPTSPVEMLPVAPIVANMQATIEKLEARIKTLEDAANP